MQQADLLQATPVHLGPLSLSDTVITTWGLMLVLGVGSWLISRALRIEPGPVQAAVEGIISTIEDAIRSFLLDLLALHDADPDLTRALSREVFHLHVSTDDDESHAGHARRTEEILRARSDVRRGNLAVMAHVFVEATHTLTRWLAHDAPAGLRRSDAVEEVVRLLTGHLRKPA